MTARQGLAAFLTVLLLRPVLWPVAAFAAVPVTVDRPVDRPVAPSATGQPDPEPGPVKYYVVPVGSVETLDVLAGRLLGDSHRSVDILALNTGRPQPDGGELNATGALRSGWVLVLPWDAAGEGVGYGRPGAQPTGNPSDAATAPTRTPADPSVVHDSTPSGNPVPTTGQSPTDQAGAVPWPQLRLSPARAWSRGTGAGVLVAVIASGSDASTPALAGHVTSGADVVGGTGRGDVDDDGLGTEMASVIVAQPRIGSELVGMAPDATVYPVRTVEGPDQRPSAVRLAAAVLNAVAAGASVVVLPVSPDPKERALSAALDEAAARDAVVVAPAATTSGGTPAHPARLRVGAVGADDTVALTYPPTSVDVLAPGRDVLTARGRDGAEHRRSAPGLAAAFTAGLVAIVRSADRRLTASEVVRQIAVTADPRDGAGAETGGWGLINPGAAVGMTANDRDLANSTAGGNGDSRDGDFRGVAYTLVAGGLLLLLLVGSWWTRRPRRQP